MTSLEVAKQVVLTIAGSDKEETTVPRKRAPPHKGKGKGVTKSSPTSVVPPNPKNR